MVIWNCVSEYFVLTFLLWFRPHRWELQTQIKVPKSLKVLPLKPRVGQYIGTHATLTAKDFFLANFSSSGPFSCIFSKTSSKFIMMNSEGNGGADSYAVIQQCYSNTAHSDALSDTTFPKDELLKQQCCWVLFTLSSVSSSFSFFQITPAPATTASVPTPVVASQTCGAVMERVTVRTGPTRGRLLAVVSYHSLSCWVWQGKCC